MAKGNAVMKAKRTTGPTPNAQLQLRHRLERCSTPGCSETMPLRTVTTAAGTIRRKCATCLVAGPHDLHDVQSFNPFA